MWVTCALLLPVPARLRSMRPALPATCAALSHRAARARCWRECRSKNDKRTLYVGGLDEDVDLAVLRAAFIPFGEVLSCTVPRCALTRTRARLPPRRGRADPRRGCMGSSWT
jgi:hypothetical protein